MILSDRLRTVDPGRVALRREGQGVRFGDLLGRADALRQRQPHADGLRLFINLDDSIEALGTILAADGLAQAVILSSPTLPPAVVAELVSRGGADAIITDRTDLAETCPVVVRHLADLPAPRDARKAAPAMDWVMTTSGTTGRPKLVVHSLDSLIRTTRLDTARGDGLVWGLLYDYTRFAGFQVVLQSLLGGSTLVVPDRHLPLDRQIAELVAAGTTHLSATPTLWRKILMTPGAGDLRLRQVTLGGEIADDAVLRALSAQWPDSRVTHIFASTEAGVGFSVNDRMAGFPESYLTDPPQGIEMRVEADHLHIRNARVGHSYLGGEGTVAQDGWVDTGDRVAIEGGRVRFLGRSSGVINVGGDKVHPEEVEAALLAHPAVRLVRIYGKANPIMGALIAADIVLQPEAGDHKALRPALQAWLAERLERHKIPAFIRFVEALETNAAGKIVRGN